MKYKKPTIKDLSKMSIAYGGTCASGPGFISDPTWQCQQGDFPILNNCGGFGIGPNIIQCNTGSNPS